MKASIGNCPQPEQQLHMAPAVASLGTWCGGDKQALFPQTVPPTFFIEQERESTCNLSGSKKRPRDAQPPLSRTALSQQRQQLLLLNQIKRKPQPTDVQTMESSRLNQSAITSSSDRTHLGTADPSFASYSNSINIGTGSSSSSSSALISMLHHHNMEMDALVRLPTEKLRSGIKESFKRHCKAIVAVIEQQGQKRVAEKQAELHVAVKRNAELEERLRKATDDSHSWFNVARTTEAAVAGLRATLEQTLLQKISGEGNEGNGGVDQPVAVVVEQEGYGDSQEDAVIAAASAAVSCSVRRHAGAVKMDRMKPSVGTGCSACRTCGEPDACVLLLPCRHLCLCPSCESSTDVCPVCYSRKNASLQINLS